MISRRRLQTLPSLWNISSPSTFLLKRCKLSTKILDETNKSNAIMIFGSSTDVGKTIVSAGILQSALQSGYTSCYLKPVQTGDMDEYFVQLYTNPRGISDITLRTIYHWSTAKSPHIAATLNENIPPPSDNEILNSIRREMRFFYENSIDKQKLLVLETAGGVLSPSPSRTLQADVYRSMRLPVVLIGDGKLGGITTTISALESLRLRGYTVYAIALIDPPGDEKFGNSELIDHYLSSVYCDKNGNEFEYNLSRKPLVQRFSALPRNTLLHDWYKENQASFNGLFKYVNQAINSEMNEYLKMKAASKSVWWPFTQHSQVSDSDIYLVESAHKDHYKVVQQRAPAVGKRTEEDEQRVSREAEQDGLPGSAKYDSVDMIDMFDGSASWWTQAVGHGNPNMALAIAESAGRFGHILSPKILHLPLVKLTEYLLKSGPGKNWAKRVFYTDNGSTGMEVALKMALKLSATRSGHSIGHDSSVRVICQTGSYHGDTLGTMFAAEPSEYNNNQHAWYDPSKPKALTIALPYISFKKGALSVHTDNLGSESSPIETFSSVFAVMDVQTRLKSSMYTFYSKFVEQYLDKHTNEAKVGALLLEPLLVGAGGMKFVDPLFQRVLIDACKARFIPVVFDEVAVGMHRLGYASTSAVLGVFPDVAVYAKMLSGGYLPISTTLASNEVFQCFYGDEKSDALLHGHSYTSNPITCAASLEAMRQLRNSPLAEGGQDSPLRIQNSFSDDIIRSLSLLPGVEGAMALGSVLAMELKSAEYVQEVVSFLKRDKIHVRYAIS